MKTTRSSGRRLFFQTAGRIALGGGLVGGFLTFRGSRTAPAAARGDLGIVRPPGALAEDDFLAKCIRCTRCTDACEAQCILLFGPEGGTHQGSPCIDTESRGCTLCMACGKACPTGALVALETMSDAKMGVAVVDERLCVSHNGTGVCGACHTACPLKNRAILQDHRNKPTVVNDACVGCGLCEEACIVHDRKAIRVVTERLWAA